MLFVHRHHEEKEYLTKALASVEISQVSFEPDVIEAGCSIKAKRLIACLLSEKRELRL